MHKTRLFELKNLKILELVCFTTIRLNFR